MIASPETVPAETGARQITFDADRLHIFKAEVARLTKIAAKLDVVPVSYEIVGRGSRHEAVDCGPFGAYELGAEVPTVTVEIRGETPALVGGWRFVGSIEHAVAGNLIHGDDERLVSYRDAAPDCDHCGLRRDRSKTVVLVNEAGELVQVGTSCLKDFLGYHGDPERLVRLFEEFGAFEDSDREWFGRRSPDLWPTVAVLAMAAGVVRCRGFVPRSAYGSVPTVDVVLVLSRVNSRALTTETMAEIMEGLRPDQDADAAMVANVQAWIAGIDPGTNEYLGNLKTVASAEMVEVKHWALLVSAYGAEHRDRDRAVRAAEKAQKAAEALTSEFVGSVGDKVELAVKVEYVRSVAGYGYNSPDSKLVVMTDGVGNRFKTFAAGAFGRVAEEGWTGTIKATVKKHETYEGRRETLITRCKVQEG